MKHEVWSAESEENPEHCQVWLKHKQKLKNKNKIKGPKIFYLPGAYLYL